MKSAGKLAVAVNPETLTCEGLELGAALMTGREKTIDKLELAGMVCGIPVLLKNTTVVPPD